MGNSPPGGAGGGSDNDLPSALLLNAGRGGLSQGLNPANNASSAMFGGTGRNLRSPLSSRPSSSDPESANTQLSREAYKQSFLARFDNIRAASASSSVAGLNSQTEVAPPLGAPEPKKFHAKGEDTPREGRASSSSDSSYNKNERSGSANPSTASAGMAQSSVLEVGSTFRIASPVPMSAPPTAATVLQTVCVQSSEGESPPIGAPRTHINSIQMTTPSFPPTNETDHSLNRSSPRGSCNEPSSADGLPNSGSSCHVPGGPTQVLEDEVGLILRTCFSIQSSHLSSPICSQPGLFRPGLTFSSERLSIPAEKKLTTNELDWILCQVFSMFLEANATPAALTWGGETYRRLSLNFLAMNHRLSIAMRRCCAIITKEMLEETRLLVARYTALLFSAPAFFSESSVVTPDAAFALTSYLLTDFNPTFLSSVVENLEQQLEAEQQDIKPILRVVVAALHAKLNDRTTTNLQTHAADGISWMMQQPQGALSEAVIMSDWFLPQAHVESLYLEKYSIFGRILRPSSLDELADWQPASTQPSTRVKYFGNLMSGHQSAAALLASFKRLQEDAQEPPTRFVALALALAKSPYKSHLFKWLDAFLEGNTARSKEATVYRLNAADERSPALSVVIARFAGLSSEGINLNVMWALFDLLKPVKTHKVNNIDPLCVLEKSNFTGSLSDPSTPRCASNEVVKLAAEKLQSKAVAGSASPPKFPTQVFWTCARGVHTLLLPVLRRYLHTARQLEGLQEAARAGNPPALKNMGDILGRLLCFHVVTQHPSFMAGFSHYVKLLLTWISTLLLCYSADGDLDEKNLASLAASNMDVTKAVLSGSVLSDETVPPPQLAILPVCMLEDVAEICSLILWNSTDGASERDVFQATLTDATVHLDCELLLLAVLLALHCRKCFASPQLREAVGCNLLPALLQQRQLESRLMTLPGVQRMLCPAVVRAYIDAQQSNYYGRISQRLALTRLFERLLPVPEHAEALQCMSKDNPFLYSRFCALMIEFLTWVLEEATSQLVEIKQREARGHTPTASVGQLLGERGTERMQQTSIRRNVDSERSTAAPSTRGQHSESEADTFDPAEVEQGRNVQEMPFEQLARTCQSLMDGGLRAFKVVSLVTGISALFIIESQLLLPQLITSLNCCLDHLVGPRCLQLKVANADAYNFQPRPLLMTLCTTYIKLHVAVKGREDQVLSAICTEGRYFSPKLFTKALKIVKRENLLNKADTEALSNLVAKVMEKAEEVEQQETWLEEVWDEIPEEFKDPMMDEIIEDPVLLPTSNHILDRKHIERHLMTETFDPFNRAPLTKEELVPQPELKHRIREFLTALKTKRDLAKNNHTSN